MNFSPSNLFSIMLSATTFHRNYQAAFRCYEQEGVKLNIGMNILATTVHVHTNLSSHVVRLLKVSYSFTHNKI